ncbi:hypothetical protein DYB38_009690 [Aphanomyces astaci]|uniref:NADPH-dependent FMN reductase-like domain-containing protein n=1 Tax=Aphanomyces astaci TaxID=112090 RepID=A0A397DXI9_APHAT|nr:hypothetical protein DYB38_009690 [Aphanomyces astaci]
MLRPLRLLASPVTNGAALPTRGSPLPPRLEAVRAPNILIVHAGDDNLRDFGLEVARGAMTVSPHVRVLHPSNASFQGDVLWADGILVGSNVYNANIDPTLMQWINTWDIQHDLGDKVAGSFVVAGGLSAGEEAVQLALLRSMMVLRLVVVAFQLDIVVIAVVVRLVPLQSSAKARFLQRPHTHPYVMVRLSTRMPSPRSFSTKRSDLENE